MSYLAKIVVDAKEGALIKVSNSEDNEGRLNKLTNIIFIKTWTRQSQNKAHGKYIL